MREVVLISGGTGSGKSKLAKSLTAQKKRIVWFDPTGDAEHEGMRSVPDLPQLSKFIAAHWRKGFRITLRPPASVTLANGKSQPGAPLALHRLCNMLIGFQSRLYTKFNDAKGICLVVDEMQESFSNAHAATAELGGMRTAISEGRHYGIDLFGISPRPQDVATMFRSQAKRAFVLELHDQSARDVFIQRIGRRYSEQVNGLHTDHAKQIANVLEIDGNVVVRKAFKLATRRGG